MHELSLKATYKKWSNILYHIPQKRMKKSSSYLGHDSKVTRALWRARIALNTDLPKMISVYIHMNIWYLNYHINVNLLYTVVTSRKMQRLHPLVCSFAHTAPKGGKA